MPHHEFFCRDCKKFFDQILSPLGTIPFRFMGI